MSKPLKVPSLARSVPKPLKVPSLARSVPKPLKVPSLLRSVPTPLKVPSLARSVPKPLSIFALHVRCPSLSQFSLQPLLLFVLLADIKRFIPNGSHFRLCGKISIQTNGEINKVKGKRIECSFLSYEYFFIPTAIFYSDWEGRIFFI